MMSLLKQTVSEECRTCPSVICVAQAFATSDSQNRDHVPPECIFACLDRQPLCLPTHTACNKHYSDIDEKIGQLIALRCGKVSRDRKHRKLRFAPSPQRTVGAVVNLDIDGELNACRN